MGLPSDITTTAKQSILEAKQNRPSTSAAAFAYARGKGHECKPLSCTMQHSPAVRIAQRCVFHVTHQPSQNKRASFDNNSQSNVSKPPHSTHTRPMLPANLMPCLLCPASPGYALLLHPGRPSRWTRLTNTVQPFAARLHVSQCYGRVFVSLRQAANHNHHLPYAGLLPNTSPITFPGPRNSLGMHINGSDDPLSAVHAARHVLAFFCLRSESCSHCIWSAFVVSEARSASKGYV